MSRLHLVNQSILTSELGVTLERLYLENDNILFFGNAVKWACESVKAPSQLAKLYAEGRVFVLETDLQGRGMTPRKHPACKAISDPEWITLCAESSVLISW